MISFTNRAALLRLAAVLVLLAGAVVYLPMVVSGVTESGPDVIEVSGLPEAIFQANAQIEVDRTGRIFIMATTNGSAKGGIMVWDQTEPGGPLGIALAPGGDQAYVAGHLSVDIYGDLRMTAANKAGTVVRSWRVPGWTR